MSQIQIQPDSKRVRHSFSRNEYGHVMLSLTGRDFTGAVEIKRLELAGYSVSESMKYCVLSKEKSGYDKSQRLMDGMVYQVALVPGDDIGWDRDRTSINIYRFGLRCGYGKPLAGFIPRLRELLSDEDLEELGFWYVQALHDPLVDAEGNRHHLGIYRGVGGNWACTTRTWHNRKWNRKGAFLFPM